MSEQQPFRFRVYHRTGDGWYVSLPHQCTTWDIVGDRDGITGGEPRDVAVAELERFIAEASQALDALRDGREYGT